MENATQICPKSLCGDEGRSSDGGLGSLFSDLRVVSEHLLLPDGIANHLPAVDQTFGDFADSANDQPARLRNAANPDRLAVAYGQTTGDESQRMAAFEGILRGGRTLNLIHVEKPHYPWNHFPDGRKFSNLTGELSDVFTEDGRWNGPTSLTNLALQRHMLETGFTDHLLGSLIAKLRASGLWNRAIVVVTADHGGAVIAHDKRRNPTKTNLGQIAPVPLFIKAPGQRQGKVVERHVCTTDILPTIARLLRIDYPWRGRPVRPGSSTSPTAPAGAPACPSMRSSGCAMLTWRGYRGCSVRGRDGGRCCASSPISSSSAARPAASAPCRLGMRPRASRTRAFFATSTRGLRWCSPRCFAARSTASARASRSPPQSMGESQPSGAASRPATACASRCSSPGASAQGRQPGQHLPRRRSRLAIADAEAGPVSAEGWISAEVRVAATEERDAVTALIAGFRDFYEETTPTDATIEEMVAQLIGDERTDFLLIGEPAVGFAAMRYRPSVWTGADDAWLEDLFLSRARARQRGGGRWCEACIERAAERGCKPVQLDSNERNQGAVGLYESLGFRSSGPRASRTDGTCTSRSGSRNDSGRSASRRRRASPRRRGGS